MPIPNYVRPQQTIRQLLDEVIFPGTRALSALVVGPRYLLSRYGIETLEARGFLTSNMTLPYRYWDGEQFVGIDTDAHEVDQVSVRVFGKNLEASLASVAATGVAAKTFVPDLAAKNILRVAPQLAVGASSSGLVFTSKTNAVFSVEVLETGLSTALSVDLTGSTIAITLATDGSGDATSTATEVKAALEADEGINALVLVTYLVGTGIGVMVPAGEVTATAGYAGAALSQNLLPVLRGRSVQVGDLVYGTFSATTLRRKVTKLLGAMSQATHGTNADKDNAAVAASATNPTSAGDTTVVLTGSAAGYTFARSVTPTTFHALGSITEAGTFGEDITLVVKSSSGGTTVFGVTTFSGSFGPIDVSSPFEANVDASGNPGYSVLNTQLGAELWIKTPGGIQDIPVGTKLRVRLTATYTAPTANITAPGTFTGTADTTILVRVVGYSSADLHDIRVRVSDTTGLMTPVVSGTSSTISALGLTLTFADAGSFRLGDTFYLNCVSSKASTENFDRIVLDGPIVPAAYNVASVPLAIEFRKAFTGEILKTDAPDTEAFTTSATEVTVDNALQHYVDGRETGYEWCSFVTGIGELYSGFRALAKVDSNNDLIEITDVSEISTLCGAVDLDNDLGYGVSRAFSGSQGVKIFALNTGGTTVDDYTTALQVVERTDKVYALAVLSPDPAVQSAIVSHVESQSSESTMNFRRAYVGFDSPGAYALLAVTPSVTPEATITDYLGENLLVTFTADHNLLSLGIAKGDYIRLPDNENVTYLIDEVVSDTELKLQAGPTAAVASATTVEVWASDTIASQKRRIIESALALSSRRVGMVWSEGGLIYDGTSYRSVPNRYLACEIAGLRSALLPQQGLTRTELTGITSAVPMYRRYRESDLDEIASNGVLIAAQNVANGPIYVRHQLTTESSKGVLYYEDSVGVVTDEISFAVKDAFEPYIGKRNVNSRTLSELRAKTLQILSARTQVSAEFGQIGPPITGFEDVTVIVDPVQRDRILVSFTIFVALPLNSIRTTVRVSVPVDAPVTA